MAARKESTNTKRKSTSAKATASRTGRPATKATSAKRTTKPRSIKKVTPKKAEMEIETLENETFSKKPSYKRVYILAALLVILGILYLSRGVFVVAMVNNTPITRTSVIRELEKQGGQQTVDSLISKELILQEAKKQNITVSEDEINGEITKIEESLKTQGSDLTSALALQGQSMADLRENIKVRKTMEKLLGEKIVVSDEEISSFYDQNKTYFEEKSLEEVRDQIVEQVKEQKLANEIDPWLTDLKANANINYFKTY